MNLLDNDSNFLQDVSLPKVVVQWAGFDYDGDMYECPLIDHSQRYITQVNDNGGSFLKIAEIIENQF